MQKTKPYNVLQWPKILVCIVFIGLAKTSVASHLMGSDITYRCISNLKYEVTLKIYRDCVGSTLSSTQNIRATCSNSNWFKLYSGTRISVKDITGLGQACVGIKSRCANGSYAYGIEEHIYKITVDLTVATGCANEFTFSWGSSARNIAITTGASNKYFYTEATVFTDLSQCNSSPVFSTPASALVCVNNDYTFNNGAIDTIDKDILSYSLVQPLSAENTSIPYNSQYSAYTPLTFLGFPDATQPLPGGFHLDSVTGNLNFRPTLLNQVTVLVLQVTEKRLINGTMRVVGITRRDIQINVINCNGNSPPVIEGESIVVCAGNTACIKIKTSDANTNDRTTLTWNAGIPGANFISSGGTIKNDTAQLCWTPTESDVRPNPYSFTVTAKDNGCPLSGQSVKAITIRVDNNPQTSFTINNPTQCLQNNSFTFTNTSNKTTFITKWHLGNGQTLDSIDAKNVTYNDTGNYKVKLVLNSLYGCADSLEKLIRVNPSPIPTFTGLKNDYCQNQGADILIPETSGGIFTGKNIVGTQYKPLKLGADTINYTVSKFGCIGDSNYYTWVHPIPQAAFVINDTQQCFDNQLFIIKNTSQVSSGNIVSNWLFADGETTDSFDIKAKQFAVPGNYWVQLIAKSANNCADTAIANVVVHPMPDAGFPPLLPFYCQSNYEYNLQPIQTGGSFIGKNIQNNLFVPTISGPDSIIYSITANGCMAQSIRYTNVLPRPVLNLGNDRVICLADPFTLNVNFPNSTYLWHDGSTSHSFLVKEPGTYSVTLYNTCDTLWDEVTLSDCFYNIVPNVFTPNGDGINDIFIPYLENALRVHLVIFDRWGEKLFETYELGKGWDGNFKDKPLPDGVYMWQMEVDYNDTEKIGAYKTFITKGNLSLMR